MAWLDLTSTNVYRSNLGSDPCPQEADVIYPDQDLESLNSSSMDTCVDTCIQNVVCVGVTLEGDTCTLKHSIRSRSYFKSHNLELLNVGFPPKDCTKCKIDMCFA